MFIINLFHINIRNFHNNDRLNKTALTILSQLKIIKVNIIENFGKENNRITLENARILRLCLVTCKIFSECKIFSIENILRKGKYFHMFVWVLENTPEKYF